MSDRSREITVLWTRTQPLIRGFLWTAVGRAEDVEDLMQEVAVSIVDRFDSFEQGTNFKAWALTIARYKVMDFVKKKMRDRHVFDDEMLGDLAKTQLRLSDEQNPRADALIHCIGKLKPRAKQLMELRYGHEMTPQKIAQASGSTANAVAAALYRVRKAIAECIEYRLAGGQQA